MVKQEIDSYLIRSLNDLYDWIVLYIEQRGTELLTDISSRNIYDNEQIADHNTAVGGLKEFARLREVLNSVRRYNEGEDS